MISWIARAAARRRCRGGSAPTRRRSPSSRCAPGLIETKRPPSRLNFEIAILSGLEWWSSAVPIMTNSLRALEVGAAELPERAADGVDHARGHVHRAEAAVRGVVRRAELAREQAGERLHLVAPGEERELLRVAWRGSSPRRFSRIANASSQEIGSNSPAPRSAPGLRLSGPREARRRVLLHDAARALGADHALVERVLGIAVDVAHLAVAQVHADAAAARAHVARGGLDLGARRAHGRRRLAEAGRARMSVRQTSPATARRAASSWLWHRTPDRGLP